MSRKLHKFQTVAEYQAYSASTDYITPCVALETIYVPDSAVSAYKTATGWSQFASKIKPLSKKPSE